MRYTSDTKAGRVSGGHERLQIRQNRIARTCVPCALRVPYSDAAEAERHLCRLSGDIQPPVVANPLALKSVASGWRAVGR